MIYDSTHTIFSRHRSSQYKLPKVVCRAVLFCAVLTIIWCATPSPQGLQWGGQVAQASNIWTNCSKFGGSRAQTQTCDSGRELYGGLCYKSCDSGWRRTAVCSCAQRQCTDIKVPCMKGLIPALCTKTICADRPWTDCGRFGQPVMPRTSCPSGYDNYLGRCYNGCPSGWTRTAVCTCERNGWKEQLWNNIKKDVEDTAKKTGQEFSKIADMVAKFVTGNAAALKELAERESNKLAHTFLKNADKLYKKALATALKEARKTALAHLKGGSNAVIAAAKAGKNSSLKELLKKQAQAFRNQFSAQRMRALRQGVAGQANWRNFAKNAMTKAKTTLLVEASVAAASVTSWAAIECSTQHTHGSNDYWTCFQTKTLEGMKFAVFGVVFAVAYSPIDLNVVIPATLKLATAVTALVAAATGGVGAVVVGVIVAYAAKMAITEAVFQQVNRLFPYYEQHIWNQAKNDIENTIKTITAQYQQTQAAWSTAIGEAAKSRPTPAPVPPAVQDDKGHSVLYLGCYKDDSDRDLPNMVASNQTPGSCVRLCREKGYLYAGIQYGGQCWCGNTFGKHGVRPETECHQDCDQDKRYVCCAAWRSNVYLTASRMGCFQDKSDRDLKHMAAKAQTPASCVALCRSKGYQYAGVQNGDQCWCGATFGKHGRVAQSECQQKCSKDNKFTCGAAWRNDIYNVAKIAGPQPGDACQKGQCGGGAWCSNNRCYQTCFGTLTRGGNGIGRVRHYWCDYRNEKPVFEPKNVNYSSVGQSCPCSNGAWCSNGKCYQTCYATATRGANKVPRKNTYWCSYQNQPAKSPY